MPLQACWRSLPAPPLVVPQADLQVYQHAYTVLMHMAVNKLNAIHLAGKAGNAQCHECMSVLLAFPAGARSRTYSHT